MAQLFNIHFSRYKFFTQKDYSIIFPHNEPLPFEVQSVNFGLAICNLNVEAIAKNEDYVVLNEGLRIESLNGHIFNSDATEATFRAVLGSNHGRNIQIVFKETIDTSDTSMQALGLSIKETGIDNKGNQLSVYKVSDRRIDASSYLTKSNAPQYCRLNNNKGYWSPKMEDSINNHWIRVDLKRTKIIGKIR